jgi:hypothetical protein
METTTAQPQAPLDADIRLEAIGRELDRIRDERAGRITLGIAYLADLDTRVGALAAEWNALEAAIDAGLRQELAQGDTAAGSVLLARGISPA